MNTWDTYLKEIESPEFDIMRSVWRNFIPESRKLVVGYIDDMKQCVGRNYRFWTRETLKYLINYVPFNQMKNIYISYYFAKNNPEVIYLVFYDTVVDGNGVLSGAEEE